MATGLMFGQGGCDALGKGPRIYAGGNIDVPTNPLQYRAIDGWSAHKMQLAQFSVQHAAVEFKNNSRSEPTGLETRDVFQPA
jgi:hypothetical protein